MQNNIANLEETTPFFYGKNKADIFILQAQTLLSKHEYIELQTLLLDIKNNLSENSLQTWSTEQLFELHWLLAEAFSSTQDNSTAFQYAQEGLEFANKLSKVEQSKAHYQIARNYGNLGSIQDGLEHALVAHELSDKTDPVILNIIGVMYYRRKNYDEAQLWYERGLDLCKPASTKHLLRIKAVLLQNMSFLYFDREDYKTSLNYNLQSLSTIPHSDASNALVLQYAIVKGYLKLDDIDNAEKHFKEARLLEQREGLPKNAAYYLNYSALSEAQNNFEQATLILQQGISYIRDNHTAWLGTAYDQLKNLYKKQGMFEKALEVSENRYELMVEQLNHDFDKQTNFLLSKVQHDMVKQEREFYRKQSLILSENLTAAQTMAQTDALTGIHNRAYLDYIAQILFETAQKIQQPLSILMIDIDHFKQVNDTFGHLVGDEVLRIVASIMKKNLRKEDVLARYGGEEFIVLLPNLTERLAVVVAEKIRSSIESYDWLLIAEALKITTSIGISESGDDLHSSIAAADKRLYKAKENGRNCCVGTIVTAN